jgi:hypothetical protein
LVLAVPAIRSADSGTFWRCATTVATFPSVYCLRPGASLELDELLGGQDEASQAWAAVIGALDTPWIVARAERNGLAFGNDMVRQDLDADWGILDVVRAEIKKTKYLDERCACDGRSRQPRAAGARASETRRRT